MKRDRVSSVFSWWREVCVGLVLGAEFVI